MERIPTTANIIDFRKATANAKRIIIIDKKRGMEKICSNSFSNNTTERGMEGH